VVSRKRDSEQAFAGFDPSHPRIGMPPTGDSRSERDLRRTFDAQRRTFVTGGIDVRE
jgi:hypothetical protein